MKQIEKRSDYELVQAYINGEKNVFDMIEIDIALTFINFSISEAS